MFEVWLPACGARHGALNLKPLEWVEAIRRTGQPTPYVGAILDVAFRDAAAVVVLMTPDDVARLRPAYSKEQDPLRGEAHRPGAAQRPLRGRVSLRPEPGERGAG
jgi:hypothetical protein